MREQLEQELEELTASLFEVQACWLGDRLGSRSVGCAGASSLTQSLPASQEAHRMVREANMKQAASEKQLKEARGKVRSPPLRPSQSSPRVSFGYLIGPSHPRVSQGCGAVGMGRPCGLGK